MQVIGVGTSFFPVFQIFPRVDRFPNKQLSITITFYKLWKKWFPIAAGRD